MEDLLETIDKLEIYARLKVAEVWFWDKTPRITIHLLKGERSKEATRSHAFPALDLDLLARLATYETPSRALKEIRAHARSHRPR
jgi:hypothetical protein